MSRVKNTRPNNSYGSESFVDEQDLPSGYNETYLTLVARDPHWIYAYWEVVPGLIDSLRLQHGPDIDRAGCVIRMYDVSCIDFNGSNANHTWDIGVGTNSSNHYINLWSDNVSYCADLGLKLPNGQFVQLARSNVVRNPRKTPSDRYDEIWMDLTDGKRSDPFVVQQDINTLNRSSKIKEAELAAVRAEPDPAVKEDNKKKRFYISEEDVREYYMKLSPLLWDIISSRIAKHARKPTDILRALNRRPTLDEILQKGLSRGQFVRRLISGASEENVEWGGASESIFSGASEESQSAKRRQFFFELWTEVIVYGRTEPDATVYHGDKVVPLRPDGTFSIRFALADAAKIPFDFKAVSGDKIEAREINTAALREKTEYKNSANQ